MVGVVGLLLEYQEGVGEPIKLLISLVHKHLEIFCHLIGYGTARLCLVFGHGLRGFR